MSLKGIKRDLLRSKLNIETIPFQPENHDYGVICIAEGMLHSEIVVSTIVTSGIMGQWDCALQYAMNLSF